MNFKNVALLLCIPVLCFSEISATQKTEKKLYNVKTILMATVAGASVGFAAAFWYAQSREGYALPACQLSDIYAGNCCWTQKPQRPDAYTNNPGRPGDLREQMLFATSELCDWPFLAKGQSRMPSAF